MKTARLSGQLAFVFLVGAAVTSEPGRARSLGIDGSDPVGGVRKPAARSGSRDNSSAPTDIASGVAATACFTDLAAGLTGVMGGAVAWGDYDNDGDLDILLTGYTGDALAGSISRVYRNSGGPTPTFTDILTGLPGVEQSAVAWGDFNNDGSIDILITGNASGVPISRVYKSSGGANPLFTDLLAGLPGVVDGAVAVADYDNDGDLDFVLTGGSPAPNGYISRVYRNNGGANPTFTDIGAGLPGVVTSAVAWGDYDNDGNLDLLLSGYDADVGYIARLYRNSGGANPTFAEASSTGGGQNGSVAGGDYDNDGDLDIVYTGGSGPSGATRVLNNDGSAFFDDLPVGLSGVYNGTAVWGDYDNDGDLDVLLVGYSPSEHAPSAKVFQSSGGESPTFTDIAAGLPGVGDVSQCSAAWGDYDNDGRLDIVLFGHTPLGTITRVYRNTCASPNTPPLAPTNLHMSQTPTKPHMTFSGMHATFTWDAATDAQTPSLGLSYNLRVGSAPGLADIVGPMASLATGYPRIPGIGNTHQTTSWEIELPGMGPYYWSVQAVDGAFAGSPFATERGTTTDVEGNPPPQTDALRSKGPNPFTHAATIEFSASRAGRVSLAIYDAKGRRVRTLADEDLQPGLFTRSWDGRNDAGRIVPPGIYFVRMKTAATVKTEKISLLR